ETKANVERFLELKKRRGARRPLTIVQIINMMNTEIEVAGFKKEWQRKADQVLVKAFATWSDQVSGIKELAKDGQRIKPAAGKRPPCLYLWRSLVIQWDGTIVLCCNDFDNKLVVGDANRQSLRDVWNSPLMRDLRRRHLRGDFATPICRDCAEWIGEPLRRLFPLALTSFRKIRGFLRGGFQSDLGTKI
ncbi:MAG: SPASM domain-containing protein, partial [Candidatus Aminicenantes bacterium]|nr:SPASM domain-containing protein [Candidatus Aminicenantes bacterium]